MTFLADRPTDRVDANRAAFSRAGSFLIGAAMVLGWVILIRLPYLTATGPNDGFFSEVATLWRQGLIPYVHAFDVKPPGFFAALALSQSVFGPSLFASRAIGILSDAATIGLMLMLTRRAGHPGVGAYAAILFSWFMFILVRDDCYSLLIALTTGAMTCVLLDLPRVRRALAAGFLIGFAGIVKQTALFECVALFALLLADREARGRRLTIAAGFIAAAAVMPLAFATYFAAEGALTPMLMDVVSFALQRPGSGVDTVGPREEIGRFAVSVRELAPILLIALATSIWQIRWPQSNGQIRALTLWLAVAIAGVLAQHSLMSTYIGALLPPVLMLSGYGLAGRLKETPKVAMIALTLVTLFVTGFSLRLAILQVHAEDKVRAEVAQILKSQSRIPDDRLYVIEASAMAVWLYPLSGLKPPTAFFIPSESLCEFPNAGPPRLAEALAERPRFIVTSAVIDPYLCAVKGTAETMRETLAHHYRRFARVENNSLKGIEGFDLYERVGAAKTTPDL